MHSADEEDTQKTVKFINDEASSVHGNLKVASIYTSESGEWKLGGFEVLSNVKEDDAVIYVCTFLASWRHARSYGRGHANAESIEVWQSRT
jgi:hypothetical protein